jgi:phospholipid/cholesterol/gamma-HCH transport system permease protein
MEYIKNAVINVLLSVSKTTRLFIKIVASFFQKPFEWNITVSQMVRVGVGSLPVTALTSFSTGMVLALQSGFATMSVFSESVYVGTVVTYSLIKELAPLVTAIVITGRIGAAITAEIGTMKVTEQIDALYTLRTNPVKYLATPRFLACVLMLPLLTALAMCAGILGGSVIGIYRLGIPPKIYFSDTFDYIFVDDYFHGFLKSIFFGGLIGLISCYKGFECQKDAEGVGKATTSSVVTTLVLILVSDYFLSALLVALGIGG